VPRHGGTLDVFVGDCFVALFDSAVEAVEAAIAIQTELAGVVGPEAVRIRIGVHMGDVVRTVKSEILGDSVNVAARIQAVARPGAITVSEDVYRAVRNRVNVPFRDLGPKALKNIREKIRIYELCLEEGAAHPAAKAPVPSRRPLALAAAGVALLAGVAALGHRLMRQPALLGAAAVAPASPQAPAPRQAAELLTVGVTGVSVIGEVPAWMQDNTRDGLNTLLSKVERLRVFSREKIDFLRQRRGLSEIEVAEALGIQKMISGSMAMQNGDVVLDVRVVDISTGLLDASESLRGPPEELIELQNEVASALLVALGVQLSERERSELFARRTKETLDGYRRLADTFGEAPERPAPQPARQRHGSSRRGWTNTAWAEATDGAESEVSALLEAYRAALERKDVEGVAATHVSLSEDQRSGFARYFESADGLSVAVSDVEVLLDGDEALVTFTRRDVFVDRDSGKEVELEVRLSTVVVRQDGRWLMRGVKRS
jgi:TolB-like protein/ketosteroid isomerase-like protein